MKGGAKNGLPRFSLVPNKSRPFWWIDYARAPNDLEGVLVFDLPDRL